MKYFTYLAVSVMIIAVISLFYLKKPNGETWLSTSVVINESQQIKDKIISFTSNTFEQAVSSVSNTPSTTRSKILSGKIGKANGIFQIRLTLMVKVLK